MCNRILNERPPTVKDSVTDSPHVEQLGRGVANAVSPRRLLEWRVDDRLVDDAGHGLTPFSTILGFAIAPLDRVGCLWPDSTMRPSKPAIVPAQARRVVVRPAVRPFSAIRHRTYPPAGWPVTSTELLLEERQRR